MAERTRGRRSACAAAAAILIAMAADACALVGADRSPQPLPPPRIARSVTENSDPMHAHAVPASGAAEPGVLYGYELYSHCGLDYWIAWDFDGSFWDPVDAPASGPGGFPPEGIDNSVDHGTIELMGPDEARFTSSHGVVVELGRSPDREREGMLCV